jgi:outer membrane protein TolC
MTQAIRCLFFGLLFIGLGSTPVCSQELLTMEEAIQQGLDNNYNIRIARNQEEIAANTNNPGNAGFLPTVNTFGNFTYTNNNIRQEFANGESNEGNNAGNTSIQAGAEVSWTAFDGFRMFATRDRLDMEQNRSRLFTSSEMQDLVTQIQVAYYEAVRVRQQIENTNESIELNQSLQNLAQAKLEIGTGTELEVLQTTNRVNADSSLLLNLEDQLRIAKIALNRLMNREPDINFLVPADIPVAALPNLEELVRLAIEQNYQLRLLNFDEQIALLQIKETRSALYPTLDVFAGYNYNFSKAEAGFFLSNTSFGPRIGVRANYDLFPGRNIKKDLANAELVKENVRLSKENLREDIISQVSQLYQNYQALLELNQLEERNLQTAQRNINLARRLYQSGRATNFDVREAILEATTVRDRLSDVAFRMKVTEIQLKSIAGIPLY